jgi:hypothetical protein
MKNVTFLGATARTPPGGLKLPKLVNTPATRRVLVLERRHMNLGPKQILHEIETRSASFPALSSVDHIWSVKTVFFATDFGRGHIRLELRKGHALTASYDFDGTQLMTRYEDSFAKVVHRIG